jgi:hypothetical protein
VYYKNINIIRWAGEYINPTANNKMNKKEFIELTGQDPEDTFGPDWENYLEDWKRPNKRETKTEARKDIDELMDLIK